MKIAIRNIFMAVFAVMLILGFAVGYGCNGDDEQKKSDKDEVAKSEIILSISEISLSVFDEYQIDYQLKNVTGTVVWSSSDESVVTVDNGLLIARATGNSTITAKIGDIVAKCVVSVRASQFSPVLYVGESKTVNLYHDGSYRIPASVTYKGKAAEASFSYSSDAETVVTVSSDGLIRAIGDGQAIITITANFKGTLITDNVVVTVRSGISGVITLNGEPIDNNEVTVEITDNVEIAVSTLCNGQPDNAVEVVWSAQGDAISVTPVDKVLGISANKVGSATVSLVLTKGALRNEYLITVTVAKKTVNNAAEVIIDKATGSAVLPAGINAAGITSVSDGTVTVDATQGAGNSVEFDATGMISGNRELKFESDTFSYVFANGIVVDMVIKNKTDLDAFGEDLRYDRTTEGSYYILGADIDYGGANWAAGFYTTANNSRFRGTFDGRGYAISNFVTHRGLVMNTVAGSTIKNLYVAPLLKGSAAGGGICNEHHGRIENCFVALTVTSGETAADFAGITSGNTADGTISNCIVKFVSYNGEPKKVNAIAAKNSGTVSDCYAISSYSDYMYADTVTDGLYDSDEVFVAAVTSLSEVNGWNLNYWSLEDNELSFGGKKIIESSIDKTATAVFDFDRNSGSDYTLTVKGIDAGLTIDDITAVKTVSDTPLAFTKSGDNLVFANAVLSGFVGEQQVYLVTASVKYKIIICMASKIIDNATDFKAYFAANKGATTAIDTYVVLKADIDLDGVNWNDVYGVAATSIFTGTFDGRGHKVSNFSTRRGLFVDLSATATVKNLFVSDDLEGDYQGGGLCWHNYGRIENCAVVLNVTHGDGTQHAGIAHFNYDGGLIANCFVYYASYNGDHKTYEFNAVSASGVGTVSGCYAVTSVDFVTHLYGNVTEGLYADDGAFFADVTTLAVADGWNGYWQVSGGHLYFGDAQVV